MTEKEILIAALRAFAGQRPGIDPENYSDWRSYRQESARVARDLRDALTILSVVEARDGITAEDLLAACKHAYSGRLSCSLVPHEYTRENCPGAPWSCRVAYCTGQYFPTEYRRAVAAVAASALWDWQRDHLPPVTAWRVESWRHGGAQVARSRLIRDRAAADALLAAQGGREYGHLQDYVDELTPGDWLRRHFREQFGRRIARAYFD